MLKRDKIIKITSGDLNHDCFSRGNFIVDLQKKVDMTRLSVNINKIATLRNARGGNLPDLIKVARDCERFGAQGITVHPRPDQRHIRYQDVYDLKPIITNEFNIEGYPSAEFIRLVLDTLPDQVTLVPDPPGVLTSNAGWNISENRNFLLEVIGRFHDKGIRTSVFVEPDPETIWLAREVHTDRVELYTESYARNYPAGREEAVRPFTRAALAAQEAAIGLNAGHDLNLDNLRFFNESVPNLLEVSIGHALICDALYFGLENTIQLYRRQLV